MLGCQKNREDKKDMVNTLTDRFAWQVSILMISEETFGKKSVFVSEKGVKLELGSSGDLSKKGMVTSFKGLKGYNLL